MKNVRKKSIAVLAGLAIAGIVGASAASLGGVSSASLGADAEVVASCDTDGVTAEYTTAASAAGFVVNSVAIGGVDDACGGLDASVTLTLTDPITAAVTRTTVAVSPVSFSTIAADANTFDVGFPTPPSAEAVTGIAIVISG